MNVNKADKATRQLLSTTRRGTASPSKDGSVALFSASQYSFDKHKSNSSLNLIDLKTGKISPSGLNNSEINEVVWLPGTETGIIYINGTGETEGGVSLWIGDIKDPKGSKKVAELDAPYSGLKVAKTPSGDLHFLVNSLAYPNGTAYNPETAVKPRSSARFYSDIYPRHWDTWLTKERYNVFAGVLSSNGSYALAGSGLRNLNHGVKFTATQSETPVQPFGDAGDYDISPDGSKYAFLSKAPQLNKANYTASYIYLGDFASSEVAVAFNGPDSQAFKAGHQGASGQPSFSPDSSKLAYIQQDEDYYESDRWQLYVLDVASKSGKIAASNWKPLSANFDRWVQGPLSWAADGQSIYATAEDYARVKIFNFPISGYATTPKALTSNTTVSSFSLLPDGSLLVSASAIWTPTEYYTLTNGTKKTLFDASQVDANLAGLSSATVSEFFFNGSDPKLKQPLHAIIVKPTNYTEGKTYPLAFLVHGGPQGSWANGWSNRWNPQVWADQGYIVVAPNPTGSTGFGQYLTDAIQGNWGGYPYQDLVNAWKYVKQNLKFADTKNGICAGASYGGYMTNWIQSNPLGKEFKALVTHDGIVNTYAAWATEELWFIRHDYNGSAWDPQAAYQKWNPWNHISNWTTPHFVVHNTLDYRLPESDGLALFNALQARGVPSRFLNFPDENHWVLKQENSLVWHTEIFNWINHYSKGTPLDDVPIGN